MLYLFDRARPRIADYEMMPFFKQHFGSLTTTLTGSGGGGGGAPEGSTEEVESEWVELERPQDMGREAEESGSRGDSVMIAEVDVTTKGWQIVSNTITK